MVNDTAPGETPDAFRRSRRFRYGIIIPIVFVVVVAIIVTIVLLLSHGAVSPPSPIDGPPSSTPSGATPGHDR
jgi:hypothetical protein